MTTSGATEDSAPIERGQAWRPEFIEPLVQQARFIFTFVLSAVITAVALSYIYSERYETFSVITFRPQDVTRIKSVETLAFGAPVPVAPFKVIGQTLQQLVRSPGMLGQVVEEFDLDDQERSYDGPPWKVLLLRLKDEAKDWAGDIWMLLKFGRIIEPDPTIDAMQELAKNVRIRSEDSYVFAILVRDRSPARAAAIADHIAELLVERQRDEERKPGELKRTQLAELLERKSAELARARAAVKTLLSRNRLASVDLETEQVMERHSRLALERSKLTGQIRKVEKQLTAIEDVLVNKHARENGQSPRRVDHTDVIHPEDFKRMASTKLAERVELEGLRARHSSLTESIDRLAGRIQTLPEIRASLDALGMSVNVLERDYVQLVDAHQEAVIRATGLTSEFTFRTPALVPSRPVSPIKFYHAALSGTLGLIVAIGLVYLLTYFNVTILFSSHGIHARHVPMTRASGADTPISEAGSHD